MNKLRIFILGIILLSTPICFAATSVDVESLNVTHLTTIVSVGTSATALPASALLGRKTIMVQNLSTSVVYLGNVNVTANEASTGGFQLLNKGDIWIGDFTDSNIVYGIVASGSANCAVWEAK